MKKFLTLTLLTLSILSFAPSAKAEANGSATAANAAEPQTIVRTPRRRYQRRTRITTTTRTVRRGRRIYYNTYRTTYFPNGRVSTKLVRSVYVVR